MGTHRNSMLGSPGYGNRFPAGRSIRRYEVVTVGGSVVSQVAFAGHGVDVLDRFQPFHQPAELGEAADLDRGRDHGRLVVVDLDFGAGEVDLAFGDHRRDIPEQAGSIPGLDLDPDRVQLAATGVPVDGHDAFLVADVHDVLAAGAMHGDPLAPGDVAADRVARHRLAALRDLGEHAALAFDANFAGGLELRDQRNERELAIAVRLRLTGRPVLEHHR